MHTNRLSRLLQDLKHQDPTKRRSAAESLSEGDTRAVYPLIKSLKEDGNFGVQDAAMRSLMLIGGEETAYMVLPLLREEPFLRNTAIIILKEIGTEAVPLLRNLLKDKDDDVRKFALDLIADIKYCDYPGDIVEILAKDPNANVRAAAAETLGALGNEEAIPALIAALNDEEWVCFSSLQSLSIFRDEHTVESIVNLLDSPSEIIRYAAIEALGGISSAKAAPYLKNRLAAAGESERTRNEAERKSIIKSLAQIGDPVSLSGHAEILIAILRNDHWNDKLIALKGLTAIKAVHALPYVIDIAGQLDPSRPDNEELLACFKDAIYSFGCVPELINVLRDPSLKYRGKVIAIEAAGYLKCQRAAPELLKFLKSDIRDFRRSTIESLGRIDSEEAHDCLMQALADKDSHVRKSAISALGSIGSKDAFEPLIRVLHEEKYADVIDESISALLKIDAPRTFAAAHDIREDIRKRAEHIAAEMGVEVPC